MARRTGPVCRECRREGTKLFLKGARCYSSKCSFERRPYEPGQDGGNRRRRRPSDYALQLREKQKMRSIYRIQETQFRRYIKRAERKEGVTGDILVQMLERRLDNVVYRANLARSRAEARVLVDQRHFEVNGRVVNVPSYQVRAGDTIKVCERSKDIEPIVAARQLSPETPDWLDVDHDKGTVVVEALPQRDQVELEADEQQVIEFYSR
ncbi:MAG: 30S ribosomal protein S4 [Armatimonadota bacterium]